MARNFYRIFTENNPGTAILKPTYDQKPETFLGDLKAIPQMSYDVL